MAENNDKMAGINGIKRMMRAIGKPLSDLKLSNDLSFQLSIVREELAKMSPKGHMESMSRRYYEALGKVDKAENNKDLCFTIDTIKNLLTEEQQNATREWDYVFKEQYGPMSSFLKNVIKGGVNIFKSTSNFDAVIKAWDDLREYVDNSDGYFIKGQETSKTKTALQDKSNKVKEVLKTYLEHKYTDMGSFSDSAKNISQLFLPNNWTLVWLLSKVGGIKYEGGASKVKKEKAERYDRDFGRGYLGHLFSKLYDMYK